jgi:hypothetical protein
MSANMVEFGGRRMRPDLAAEVVELELMAEALDRGARHHEEHGGTAGCGCPLRIDGTEPYLHRDGCSRQGDLQLAEFAAPGCAFVGRLARHLAAGCVGRQGVRRR